MQILHSIYYIHITIDFVVYVNYVMLKVGDLFNLHQLIHSSSGSLYSITCTSSHEIVSFHCNPFFLIFEPLSHSANTLVSLACIHSKSLKSFIYPCVPPISHAFITPRLRSFNPTLNFGHWLCVLFAWFPYHCTMNWSICSWLCLFTVPLQGRKNKHPYGHSDHSFWHWEKIYGGQLS